MKELLEYLVESITGEKATVEQSSSNELKLYTIYAPKKVMGILIGKSGRTIRAIRSLSKVRAIVDKENIVVNLEER